MSSEMIFLSILGAILIGAMSPGPSFVLVSRTAIAQGRSAGIAAALGMGVGGACLGGLALLGLSALLLRAEAVFLLVKVLGGLYLVYLGFRIFRDASAPITFESGGPDRAKSLGGNLVMGLLIQLSNPKTVIVYGSIFAALLPAEPEHWLMFTLVPMLFGIEAGWYLVVALVFSANAPRRAYMRAKIWLDRTAGAVMAGLGIRLAAEGISSRIW